jgi:hypothetical protein
MKKWKMILPIVVVISFLLSGVSVNAQVNNGNNENDWAAHHSLDIHMPRQNGQFRANGVDEAKMNIAIRNKETNHLALAQSNIEVILCATNSIVEPTRVTIFAGKAMSEEISLTSRQPGTASVEAEAANFTVTNARVEFVPPVLCVLHINMHQQNGQFHANGMDEAKMNIQIRNKDTNSLVLAQSDIEVCLSATNNSIVKPSRITIFEGTQMSEDISLTSTQPGIASVTAEAVVESVDFIEVGTASVEFVSPPVPSKLLLTASPNENVLADGRHPTVLTVKLLDQNEKMFTPLVNLCIDMGTNKGDTPPQIFIYREKVYGQGNFTTYKRGTVNITAISHHHLNLNDSTMVSFISPITLLTLFFAMLGGLCAGIIRYFQDIKGKIFIPKKIDGTFYFGFVLNLFLHSLFGIVIFILAFFDIPRTNVFKIPICIGPGAFVIGFIGGFSFFVIINSFYKYKTQIIIGGGNNEKGK